MYGTGREEVSEHFDFLFFFFNWVFIFNYVNGVYACVGEVST